MQLELEGQRTKQGELVVNVQEKRVSDLEMDIRGLMDQNIALTAENTSLSADAAQLRHHN